MKKLREWKHRHWGEHALVGAMVVGSASDWTPVSDKVSDIIGWMVGGAMIVAFVVHFSHLRGALCEDCIKAMPLDGHETARRRKPLLWAYHRLYDSRNTMLYVLLGLVAVSALAGNFLEKRSAPSLILFNLVTLGIIGIYVANGVHRRLQPWCPYCRWGRDDEDETVAPAPAPVTTA